MNDILDLIKSRRTIRKFTPQQISWENVSRIIDAGRHAPSSGNIQNWKFVVCFEPAVRQKLAELAYEQYDLATAPILIVILAEVDKAERYYGLRGERLYSIQNCAAAIQNMILEAHSLGIGSNWVGAFDEDGLKQMLKIPDYARPQAILALGYPAEHPPKPPKYPLETVTYFHHWRLRMRDPSKYMHDTAVILGRKMEAAKDFVKEKTQQVVDKAKESIKKEEE